MAGVAYLVITIVAVLYGSLVESKLIESGNDAATATNILANESLFRVGIVLVLIIYVSVVVASWALYVILRTVHKNLALLALLLRSAEAVLGAATVLISFVVLYVLGDNGPSSAFEPEQLQVLAGRFIDVRTAGLDIVLIFIGLGATVFCYLLFKSRYIPKPLAAWGILTYLSMLSLALVSILFPNHPLMLANVLYGVGASFELVLGLWLVFKGVDLQQWEQYA
ncbi:MAG: DUF4386 domain-containing protein [Deltaproteobacteria bacterium]|nr:DUF4386 domain-containing protein [Deltaproteobacteria bacterium]MBW2379467.1 DUF4386 domain-containing protein [Deltaproteobacteria bacterium]MBW2627637.1 DUF4386 domain-containing protein [Deltaproteobacteria bacterium]